MSLSRADQYKPTEAFRRKEEQLRASIEAETNNELREDVGKLFKDTTYSDLQLCVESNELPVHSCILKARYPQFYEYCVKHAKDNRVLIEDLQCGQLERCLRSLYTKDEVDCSDIDKILSLNNFASKASNSDLSTDLLSLFDENNGDIDFIVEEKVVKAHRAILACRSDYFSAMFSASWKETCSSSVTMPNTSYSIFIAVLRFLYGGTGQHFDDSFLSGRSHIELLQFSDMYGVTGLQKVIVNQLKITKCHLFHKPCAYCIPQVYECIKLCEAFYFLEPLRQQCIQWMAKHFDKTLGCKQFISLPEETRNQVKREIEKQLDVSAALETWAKCTKMMLSLDNRQTHWTRSLQDYLNTIRTTCLGVAIEQFITICSSMIFENFWKQINYSTCVLEYFVNALLEALTVQNCCYVLQGFLILVHDEVGEETYGAKAYAIMERSCKKCEKFVVGSIGQVSKTKGWKTISDVKKRELKNAGSFVNL